MSDNHLMPYFRRYLRLYSLQLMEQSVTSEVVLRVRVATTRYLTSILPVDVDSLWQQSPGSAIDAVQDMMMPRLEILKSAEDAWLQLGLNQPDAQFEAFRAQRHFEPSGPRTLVPVSPRRFMPPVPINRQLDSITRFLQAVHTGILVADAAVKLWQDFRLGQENVRIAQARRVLLEDALRAGELSQNHALQKALDPGFVEHFLTAGGDDPAYDILFSDDD